MSGVELGRLVADAFDDTRFAETIRTSVREAVEGIIAKTEADADTRREGHAAGERLGRALVARAAAAAHAHTARSLPPAIEDAEHRAEAFRVMAGVGRSHRRLGRGRTAEEEELGG